MVVWADDLKDDVSVMGWSLVVSRRRAVLLQILWSIMREREQHVVSRSLIQQNIAGAHASRRDRTLLARSR